MRSHLIRLLAAVPAALLAALPLLGLPAATVEAREPGPTRLDTILPPLLAAHDVPALAVAVVTSDGILAHGVAGVRRRGGKEKATIDDLWHLGSCTKSMTATLVGKLVEEKKLRFDMTLAEAFPDLAETMHPGWKGATLDLLLRNRGGMPGDLRREGLWGALWRHEGTPREARRLLTKTVLSWPPSSKPGTKYEYSNAGFAVAGHMAETALDTPYETLLLERVLAPLKATPAGFGAPGAEAKGVTQPWGHRLQGDERPPVDPRTGGADNPPAIAPAGRVHMTIDAWARYARLHLRGARPGTDELLLTRETLHHLHTPREGETYALGWGLGKRDWAGGRVLHHNGSNTMWFASVWIAPERDVAFLAACNQGGQPGHEVTDSAIAACIAWWQQVRRGAR